MQYQKQTGGPNGEMCFLPSCLLQLQLRLSDRNLSRENWLLLFESYELFSTCIPLHASNYHLARKNFVISGKDVSLYFLFISFGLIFIPLLLQNCTSRKEVGVLL